MEVYENTVPSLSHRITECYPFKGDRREAEAVVKRYFGKQGAADLREDEAA